MSDDLSRKIALANEPEPTWPRGYSNEHACTPLGWWRPQRPTDKHPEWSWVAKDYTNPEIAMRLLKELIEVGKADFFKIQADEDGLCIWEPGCQRGTLYEDLSFEEAIARAWLAMKGLA